MKPIWLVGLVFALAFAAPVSAQEVNPDCAINYGNITVILEGTNDSPGMNPDSLARLYYYLAERVVPAPYHEFGKPLVVQYISAEDGYAIFPGAWTEDNWGMQWYVNFDGCQLLAGMDNHDLAGAVARDDGDIGYPRAVGTMAHEMTHSLGADHGPFAHEGEANIDPSLTPEQDANYWGFLVRYSVQGCPVVAHKLGDEHVSRCEEIRAVLGF